MEWDFTPEFTHKLLTEKTIFWSCWGGFVVNCRVEQVVERCLNEKLNPKVLTINDGSISTEGLETLTVLTTLEDVNLDCTNFDNYDMSVVRKMIGSWPFLKKLSFKMTKLNQKFFDELVQFLAQELRYIEELSIWDDCACRWKVVQFV